MKIYYTDNIKTTLIYYLHVGFLLNPMKKTITTLLIKGGEDVIQKSDSSH
ncbi:MAG: hypothetical protein KOO66_07695 [Bacteroidales bacterium]|nr:hypothetical protein [Bacteroidales bacterium]